MRRMDDPSRKRDKAALYTPQRRPGLGIGNTRGRTFGRRCVRVLGRTDQTFVRHGGSYGVCLPHDYRVLSNKFQRTFSSDTTNFFVAVRPLGTIIGGGVWRQE